MCTKIQICQEIYSLIVLHFPKALSKFIYFPDKEAALRTPRSAVKLNTLRDKRGPGESTLKMSP